MPANRITQSVELGCTNSLNDVKIVPTAFNKLLKLVPPTKALIVVGRFNHALIVQKLFAPLNHFKVKY
jgi:hypothetical protein